MENLSYKEIFDSYFDNEKYQHFFANYANLETIKLPKNIIEQMQNLITAVEKVITISNEKNNNSSNSSNIRNDNLKGIFMGYDFHLQNNNENKNITPKLIEINTNAGGAFLNLCLLNAIYKKDKNNVADKLANEFVAMFKNDTNNTTLTSGTLETFTLDMPQYSDNRTRTIHVWLPDGYDSENTDKKYPVFYMHDGQNLFDMYTSYAGEWMVDEAIADMMDNGYEGAIIVGIENSADRWNEYSPEWVNVGSSLPNNSSGESYAQFVDNPSGDKYGEFIVDTLKPYIDRHYNVRTDKNSTGIGGSSMGGLISYYIGMKYPDVFGQVLSFSPAFWMYSEDTIASVVESYDYSNTDNLPKVFLYTGGANQMEKDTITYVDLVYNKMSENGYPEDKLSTLTDTTKDHNEAAWSEYFPLAYKWLVGFAT